VRYSGAVATAIHPGTATEEAQQFCWRVLPNVSRSFAAVIRQMPLGAADAVMVSYLLCRLADSIEDSSLPLAEKQARLRRFPLQIEQRSDAPEFVQASISPVYRELLSRPDAVFACYRALDEEARGAILACVQEMSEGMAEWAARTIATVADQDSYCYYVAGVVGRLLTSLFRIYGMVPSELEAELASRAVQFGLALQKVNILRDVRADMLEGRCYWPEELMRKHDLDAQHLLDPAHTQRAVLVLNDLIADVQPYFASALEYIELLPRTQLRLRSFCAIPLFMATATARVCRSNPDIFLADEPVKIPRREAQRIVSRSKMFGWSNGYLRSWYRGDLAALASF
jgi:farnesyl-diphosphate farnesyltransferase